MAELRLVLQIVGEDQASPSLRAAAGSLDRLHGSAAGAQSSVHETGTAVGRLGDSAARAHSPLSALPVLLGGLAAAAGVAAGAVAGIKFNALQEQALNAFTTMLGSADAAREHLEQLKDFAAKTPFELPGLIQASQKLQAMEFAARDVIPMLTIIGNAVSGLGGGAFEIDRVVRALGQMQAKGKAMAEEMLQLTELGIPAWRMLAETIGTDIPHAMKLVEDGAIDADTVIAAVLSGMDQRFSGLMDVQSRSFLGLLSTLKDTARQIAGDVTEPLFRRMAVGLQGLVDFLSGPELQAGVRAFTAGLEAGLDKAGHVLSFFQDRVGPAFANIRNIAEATFGGDLRGAVRILEGTVELWASAFVAWVKPVWDTLKLNLGKLILDIGAFITENGPFLYQKIVREWAPSFADWVQLEATPKMLKGLRDLLTALGAWIKDEGAAAFNDYGGQLIDELVHGANLAGRRLRGFLIKWVQDELAQLRGIGGPPSTGERELGYRYYQPNAPIGGPPERGFGRPESMAAELGWEWASGDYRSMARHYARLAGIDEEIFVRQLEQESNFNPAAVSPAGARGIGQFMPGTAAGIARQLGVPIERLWREPELQIQGAALHMGGLLGQFGGDYRLALAAYNAGPVAVQQAGGVPPFQEVQQYLDRILGKVGIGPGTGKEKKAEHEPETAIEGFMRALLSREADMEAMFGRTGAKLASALLAGIEQGTGAGGQAVGRAMEDLISQLREAGLEDWRETGNALAGLLHDALIAKTPETREAALEMIRGIDRDIRQAGFDKAVAEQTDKMADAINKAIDQTAEAIHKAQEQAADAIDKLFEERAIRADIDARTRLFDEMLAHEREGMQAHFEELRRLRHEDAEDAAIVQARMREDVEITERRRRGDEDINRRREREETDAFEQLQERIAEARKRAAQHGPRGTPVATQFGMHAVVGTEDEIKKLEAAFARQQEHRAKRRAQEDKDRADRVAQEDADRAARWAQQDGDRVTRRQQQADDRDFEQGLRVQLSEFEVGLREQRRNELEIPLEQEALGRQIGQIQQREQGAIAAANARLEEVWAHEQQKFDEELVKLREKWKTDFLTPATNLADTVFDVAGEKAKGIEASWEHILELIRQSHTGEAPRNPPPQNEPGVDVGTGVMAFRASRRQQGGPVWPGGAFLVGEAGPELFFPGSSGHVMPGSGGGIDYDRLADKLAAAVARQSITVHVSERMIGQVVRSADRRYTLGNKPDGLGALT